MPRDAGTALRGAEDCRIIAAMKLTEHLSPDLIKVPMAATDKSSAITELVDLVAAQGLADTREQLLSAVLRREAQRTTGIGRGFAIPHAKCDAVSRLVIGFGRTVRPIDFGAFDGQPVSLVALLASPTHSTSEHIQALARLSRLVTQGPVLDGLMSAKSADEVFRIIAENEDET
jgi:mannitol/fructose-specific phosphotransferase system IIA component (Ntr-type)